MSKASALTYTVNEFGIVVFVVFVPEIGYGQLMSRVSVLTYTEDEFAIIVVVVIFALDEVHSFMTR